MTNVENSLSEKKDEQNNSHKESSQTIDLQLRRYTTILGYLQYENTVYWTRSQLFLVANATLFGFFSNNIPLTTNITYARLYTLFVPAIGGLILCFLWNKTLRAASTWIQRWTSILLQLEPEAFGEIEVFRFNKLNEKKGPIKNIAIWTVRLFIILWLLSIIYLLFISILKIIEWDIF